MKNLPSFPDFIAEKVGHRDWYTARRPSPKRAKHKTYLPPRASDGIMAEYRQLFGVCPRTLQAC